MKKNILLIGRGTIAVNCLTILHTIKHLPQIIVCDPEDTGKDTWTKSLRKKALQLGYKIDTNLLITRKVNNDEFVHRVSKLTPSIDIIFSIQPKSLFRFKFIRLAKQYVVNLHFAPLPLLRGVATSPWAILDGLTTMGVTLHLIQDEGIDNGPILAQTTFPITEKDTARTIYDTCITCGTKLFKDQAKKIITGKVSYHQQDHSKATYHPLGELDFQQTEVDLDQSFEEVLTFIRSRIFPPFQLPYFTYDNKKVIIEHFAINKEKLKGSDRIKKIGRNYIVGFKHQSLVITPKKA